MVTSPVRLPRELLRVVAINAVRNVEIHADTELVSDSNGQVQRYTVPNLPDE